jgi:L-Ala-D/L-Glu epimerase / N-acetyl-D-glutamate racemase
MVFALMLSLSDVTPSKWTLNAYTLDLPLIERFTIARGSWDAVRNVFVTLEYDGVRGFGEVNADDPEDVLEEIRGVYLDGLRSPFDLEGLSELISAGSARCALDIALHDVAAKLAHCSVGDLLGVGGRPSPPTSMTVPIAEVDRMVQKAQQLADHPVLKVKVGFDGDVEAVRAVRQVYGGAIRIDANEGWDAGEAIDRLEALEPCDIELCEQPVPAADRDGLARVAAATSIPIFADEAACTARDVAELAGEVDGVNLKLRKAGGIRETVKAIATARSLGLGVMLGCDLESGVAATAQAHVAPLVDYADVDGPLLLREDPFPGVTYAKGALQRPPGPGLGLVREPL